MKVELCNNFYADGTLYPRGIVELPEGVKLPASAKVVKPPAAEPTQEELELSLKKGE